MTTNREGFKSFFFEELLVKKSLSIENIVNELKPDYPLYIDLSSVHDADPISANISLLREGDLRDEIVDLFQEKIDSMTEKNISDYCSVDFSNKKYVEFSFHHLINHGETTFKFYSVDRDLLRDIADELNIPEI